MLFALAVSAFFGVVGALSHPVLSRESSAFIGLASLATLAVPILGAVSGLGSSGFEIPEVIPAVSGVSLPGEEAFSEAVRDHLCSELSVSSDELDVSVEGFCTEKMRAEGIAVTLRGAGVFLNPADVRRIVCESFLTESGECEVKIELGG